MERAAHPTSGRRGAIRGAGSLVVSGAALSVLLVLWAVASREPRGPNTPGDGLVLALVSAPGLAGAGLVFAVVVRSRLLPGRDALGTWFAVGCAFVVVQLLLSCLAWWLTTTNSVFISCDQRPLLPGLYVVGQALGMAGAGWSVRLAGSAAVTLEPRRRPGGRHRRRGCPGGRHTVVRVRHLRGRVGLSSVTRPQI
jgi:hypothetical protein